MLAELVKRDDAATPSTIDELSAILGGHPNTVRAHLEALVDDGLARRQPQVTGSRGRPAWEFSPTARGREAVAASTASAPRQFVDLVVMLCEELGDSPAAEEIASGAGRRWGEEFARRHAESLPSSSDPTAVTLDLLDAAGFSPKRSGRIRDEHGVRDRLRLTTCPFTAVGDVPPVVCRVHESMVSHAFDAIGVTARLMPYSADRPCVVMVERPQRRAGGA